jgi:hypothetical protein
MGLRVLLLSSVAALTQLPASHALTAAAVLAVLLVVVSVARQSPVVLVVGAAPRLALAREGRLPVLRQAIVAGRGRPQPRAPGARSCAAS